MADVRTIPADKYNTALAHALVKDNNFEKPVWIDYIKTGVNKVRPTAEELFWQKRAASILRQIYIRGTVGVQRLRTRYGGRKNRGARPATFHKGSGKIIRLILQQAEKAGYVEKSGEKKKGRKLTPQGIKFMESVKI